MILYDAYFDESGCHDGSGLLAVGGYLVRADRAKAMHSKWRSVLARHDLPYFHMVDCAHGNEPFKRLSPAQRLRVEIAMIKLIKSYTALGLVTVVNPKRFAIERFGLPDPYTYCLTLAVMGLCAWLSDKGPAKVAFFVEAGHQNGNKAHSELTRWSQGEDGAVYYAGHSFAPKRDVPLLQAADLLVWQAAKFMKDKLSQARPPRKDFLRLMKHPHAFAYAVLHQGVLSHSMDNGPHIEDPFRDQYLRSVFSDTPIADDIVNQYHLMVRGWLRRGWTGPAPD